MAEPHNLDTMIFLVAPGCAGRLGCMNDSQKQRFKGHIRASVHRQKLSLQERGLGAVLGSQCCMEKMVTVMKDGHLLHLVLSPRVFAQTGLLTALRGTYCDRAQFQ